MLPALWCPHEAIEDGERGTFGEEEARRETEELQLSVRGQDGSVRVVERREPVHHRGLETEGLKGIVIFGYTL